nr:hypothetical protein GCM10025730_55080 [Promicromonospora thailandica]
MRRAGAYVALTKPRVIELLLVTTVPTMILAADGLPSFWLIVATLIGGAGAAGSANAFNMWWDRDIDQVMNRTKKRPLATGRSPPPRASCSRPSSACCRWPGSRWSSTGRRCGSRWPPS